MPKKAPATPSTAKETLPDSESTGLSKDYLNTEIMPVAPLKQQVSPCVLCNWLQRRLDNTSKELIKHMTIYHLKEE